MARERRPDNPAEGIKTQVPSLSLLVASESDLHSKAAAAGREMSAVWYLTGLLGVGVR